MNVTKHEAAVLITETGILPFYWLFQYYVVMLVFGIWYLAFGIWLFKICFHSTPYHTMHTRYNAFFLRLVILLNLLNFISLSEPDPPHFRRPRLRLRLWLHISAQNQRSSQRSKQTFIYARRGVPDISRTRSKAYPGTFSSIRISQTQINFVPDRKEVSLVAWRSTRKLRMVRLRQLML